MDAFIDLHSSHLDVECMHGLKIYPWRRRVIRIFETYGHIIEIVESMGSVTFREFDSGHTHQDTAEIIQQPLTLVQPCYEKHMTAKPYTVSSLEIKVDSKRIQHSLCCFQ